MKRIICIISALLLLLASCKEVYRYTSDTFFTMNTVVNTVISDEIGKDVWTEDILSDIENRMSRTLPDSEISRLNNGEDVTLSDDTYQVLEKALQIAKDTDYAFNPCMGTLTDLWDITSGKNIVPADEEIKEALSFCDASLVEISDGKITIPDGMKIDLGGVAKGYALYKASEYLSEEAMGKAVGADFCISLGGNVAVSGSSKSRKEAGQKGWKVGITNPFEKSETLGSIVLENGCVSVSGAYERYFEKDGRIYHHIFDSKAGCPVESGLASAVVISDDGLEADALSTALFVMGKKRAEEFYAACLYDFEMILVTNEGEILVSEGIAENFTVQDEAKNINTKNIGIIKK